MADVGEALLTRLAGLFQQDPLIDEVGLLFGVEQSELTPETAFVLEEHKLGVAFAAGIPLFRAARTQFHALNALLQKEAAELTQPGDGGRRAQLLHCTRAILLISADFYTAWNTRKSFVTRGWLDAQDEVHFTNLVFTLHPKSIDTWAYRRWLAIRVCEELSGEELSVFYRQQVEVCSRLAELKPRNYHAWSFRHWIVSRLPLNLVLEELIEMETWCRTHVSDHSGWNHRQHTLNVLTKLYQDSGDKRDAVRSLILAEYKFVSDIMTSYPTHEALWCNRRYVVQWLLNQMAGEVASSDLAAICDLISRASATLLKEKPGSVEATALHTSWDDIFMSLSSDAVEWSSVRAIFYEIESAWNYGNQFSRRYAVWCLARLRVFLRRRLGAGERDPDVALTRELGSLASSLHAHLVQKDPVLKDLWLCV